MQGIHVPPAEFLSQQIDAVLSDIGASAVKTGMLPNAQACSMLSAAFKDLASRPHLCGDAARPASTMCVLACLKSPGLSVHRLHVSAPCAVYSTMACCAGSCCHR